MLSIRSLGGDDLSAVLVHFLYDPVGVGGLIGQKPSDPIVDYARQRAEANDVVRLTRCQDEAERTPLAVVSRVEL